MSGAIVQEIELQAPPDRVYRALTDSKQFSALTGGAPANIDAKPGGEFSGFGGMITGRILELVPNERIVEAWRAGNWDAGVYSIVTFTLKSEGSKTKLVLEQRGHPDGTEDHLKSGWPKMYFDPLKKFLS